MPRPNASRLRKDTHLLDQFAVPLGIDLSAWISGASFLLGAGLAGPQKFVGAPLKSLIVVLAYIAFLAAALLIQRHMRLKASATTFGTPQNLTTTGLFEFTRNPIYVAFLFPLASLALFSVLASAAAIAFYVLAMNATVIPREEQDLKRIFGNAFLDYAAKTRRWI
jgi:protein-S-isoprenylcysteine O-methyltransferase Ste14